MLLRAGVLALLSVTIVACGSEDERAAGSTAESTAPPTTVAKTAVRGAVLAGPTCPVETAENPCPPAPVAGRVDAQLAGGQRVAHTRTDAKGQYRLSLAPGKYTLLARTDEGGLFCEPVTVTVSGARPVEANISCDTGIR
jgi:hypothetical protein